MVSQLALSLNPATCGGFRCGGGYRPNHLALFPALCGPIVPGTQTPHKWIAKIWVRRAPRIGRGSHRAIGRDKFAEPAAKGSLWLRHFRIGEALRNRISIGKKGRIFETWTARPKSQRCSPHPNRPSHVPAWACYHTFRERALPLILKTAACLSARDTTSGPKARSARPLRPWWWLFRRPVWPRAWAPDRRGQPEWPCSLPALAARSTPGEYGLELRLR